MGVIEDSRVKKPGSECIAVADSINEIRMMIFPRVFLFLSNQAPFSHSSLLLVLLSLQGLHTFIRYHTLDFYLFLIN